MCSGRFPDEIKSYLRGARTKGNMTNLIESLVVTLLVTNTVTEYPKVWRDGTPPPEKGLYGQLWIYPVVTGEWVQDTSAKVRRIVREVRRERTAHLEGKQLLLSSELLERDVRYQSLTWTDTTDPSASNAFRSGYAWSLDFATNLVDCTNVMILQSSSLDLTNVSMVLTDDAISNYLQRIKAK